MARLPRQRILRARPHDRALAAPRKRHHQRRQIDHFLTQDHVRKLSPVDLRLSSRRRLHAPPCPDRRCRKRPRPIALHRLQTAGIGSSGMRWPRRPTRACYLAAKAIGLQIALGASPWLWNRVRGADDPARCSKIVLQFSLSNAQLDTFFEHWVSDRRSKFADAGCAQR